ncbi:hypothetical protein [Nocardia sp. NBC_01388]|uniref:beta-sandwich lipoprotein n=1 Tax=Nocardia sp. NBC_01388 TaxID=2903596 RepID=UPI0032566B05
MSRTAMSVALAVVVLSGGVVLTGCSSTDADVVNNNISQDSDNFKVNRRVSFYNGITDKVMLVVEGFCSIDIGPDRLTVTCKVGDGYKRDYLGRSNNVTFIVEQLDSANVDPNHYKVVLKPEALIPNFETR